MRRVIVFTGKGGVGKSVMSAATAVKLSDMGYAVALVSADPAHTISHYLDVKTVAEEVRISSNLFLYYVDPVREVMAKFRETAAHIIDVIRKYGIDEVLAYELAMLPMVTETVGMLKVLDLYESGRFDVIIMDTIPSGEALRLLYLPKVLNSVHKRLIKVSMTALRTASRILSLVLGPASRFSKMVGEEEAFFEQIETLGRLLEDHNVTSVRIIANPDTSSIDDAVKTVGLAQIFGLNVDLGIMNRCFLQPKDVPRRWVEEHEKYVRQFEACIYPIPVRVVPSFGTELKGMRLLREAADALYGSDDPIKVFHVGKIVNVRYLQDRYILELKLPSFITDCQDVVMQGDELVISLTSERGIVEKILPLPTMLKLARPIRAYIERGTLYVEFAKAS